MPVARGSFEVTLNPEPVSGTAASAALGRYALDKRYEGELAASSRGEMISAATAIEGSAGYVAIERVDGSLHGHSGGFALQHFGTMTRGVGKLTVEVIPDSGTGELLGIRGTMSIRIEQGRHFYEIDYTLA